MRTNKAFRKFLRRRSAEPLWKKVFEKVDDLPDCPTWLSEPEYASLVFDNYCHVRVMTPVLASILMPP